MPGGTHPLDLQSVCTYGLYLALHSDTMQGVTFCRNALAVYTIHGLNACMSKQVYNSRESTQIETKLV